LYFRKKGALAFFRDSLGELRLEEVVKLLLLSAKSAGPVAYNADYYFFRAR
jgi:hypothetical protein